MNTPELPTLRARGFRETFPLIEGDPTYEHLGQAALLTAAARTVFTREPRDGDPPLDLSELGQAHAFTAKLANMILAREAAQDRPLDALEADGKLGPVQTALATIETRLTTIETKMTSLENTLTETRDELQSFKTTFASWSRPFAQNFNKQCLLNTGFQPVPYADDKFPDVATMKLLSSRNSVLALDMTTLSKICKQYAIKFPSKWADRDGTKMKKQLLDHLCGEPNIPDEEEGGGEPEDEDD
ncbi:hypothetical protein FRC01_006044 [Tulasnella sp. 417]|nr:hypothetical protein FRC01_006044 [Tulasnella sp. 417]